MVFRKQFMAENIVPLVNHKNKFVVRGSQRIRCLCKVHVPQGGIGFLDIIDNGAVELGDIFRIAALVKGNFVQA